MDTKTECTMHKLPICSFAVCIAASYYLSYYNVPVWPSICMESALGEIKSAFCSCLALINLQESKLHETSDLERDSLVRLRI